MKRREEKNGACVQVSPRHSWTRQRSNDDSMPVYDGTAKLTNGTGKHVVVDGRRFKIKRIEASLREKLLVPVVASQTWHNSVYFQNKSQSGE